MQKPQHTCKVIHERVGLRGEVELWAHAGKRLVAHHKLSNAVLNQGRLQMLRVVLGQAGYTGINRMEVGDGGAVGSGADQIFTPRAFVAAENPPRLRNAIGYVQGLEPVTDGDFDAPTNSVAFRAIFHASHGGTFHLPNGIEVVNEVALLAATPTEPKLTVAAVAFPSVPFGINSTIVLTTLWRLFVE